MKAVIFAISLVLVGCAATYPADPPREPVSTVTVIHDCLESGQSVIDWYNYQRTVNPTSESAELALRTEMSNRIRAYEACMVESKALAIGCD